MQPHHYRDIPVAVLVEESEASLRAVEWATREAGVLGRRLLLLYLNGTPSQLASGSAWQSARTGVTRTGVTGRVLLAEAAELARRTDPRVRLDREVLDGPSARVLLKRTANFTVLALGQHSRRPFGGEPPDSYGPWLAAHALCPIVLVPDAAERRDDLDDPRLAVGIDDSAEYERPPPYVVRAPPYAVQGTWT
jgi:nucleotide-binding universal stress UspA family protein